MSKIIHTNNPAEFRREVLESPVPVVVDFWAEWCGPCRLVGPELEKIATAHGSAVRVAKVDVDRNADVAAQYGIQSIPTIALFRSGQWVASSIGAKTAREIERELGLTATGS